MDNTIRTLLIKALTSPSEEEAKSVFNLLRKRKIDWFEIFTKSKLEDSNNEITSSHLDKMIIKKLMDENAYYKNKLNLHIMHNQKRLQLENKENKKILVSSFVVIFLLILLFFI